MSLIVSPIVSLIVSPIVSLIVRQIYVLSGGETMPGGLSTKNIVFTLFFHDFRGQPF